MTNYSIQCCGAGADEAKFILVSRSHNYWIGSRYRDSLIFFVKVTTKAGIEVGALQICNTDIELHSLYHIAAFMAHGVISATGTTVLLGRDVNDNTSSSIEKL